MLFRYKRRLLTSKRKCHYFLSSLHFLLGVWFCIHSWKSWEFCIKNRSSAYRPTKTSEENRKVALFCNADNRKSCKRKLALTSPITTNKKKKGLKNWTRESGNREIGEKKKRVYKPFKIIIVFFNAVQYQMMRHNTKITPGNYTYLYI